MLRYLSIKNFALIENCEIDLRNGLNIITGETGAGKSIIIQALAILLGGRASMDQIRSGMEEAVLNATIDITGKNELFSYLKNSGVIIDSDEIIIRRILTNSGKSRSFINGSQITTKEMNVIAGTLFDFHGQHEGISLLKKNTHLRYLDSFLHLDKELAELEKIFKELKKTEESLNFIEETKKNKEKQLDLLNYEINEIEVANIKAGEDEELKREIKICENMEKLISNLEEVYSTFSGEYGVINKMKSIKSTLNSVSEMDESFNKVSNTASDAYYQLEDVFSEISSKKEHYNYEPGKIDKLIERNEVIEKLKRKYGGTFEKINEYLEKARQELNLIKFSSEESEKLKNNLTVLKNKYLTLASVISKKRKGGKIELEKKVMEELVSLSMVSVAFSVSIEQIAGDDNEKDYISYEGKKIKFNATGIDDVEFLISPNKGEPLKSLIKIASGGELSRIILALKSILFENDDVNTMIFDEIDAGIGGKVGIALAKSIKKLANHKQIICITHLPQIASAGSRNYRIIKNVVNERTVSVIETLDKNKKIKEIARMLSGSITEASLKHANELIVELE